MTLHEQIWRLGIALHFYGHEGKVVFDMADYPNPEDKPCIRVFGGTTEVVDAWISQDGGEMVFTHPMGATMTVNPKYATEEDLESYGIGGILPKIYQAMPESKFIGTYDDFLSLESLPMQEKM